MYTTTEPLAFGPAEAARVVGLSRAALYARINRGEISALKDGRRTLITRAELKRYLASLAPYCGDGE